MSDATTRSSSAPPNGAIEQVLPTLLRIQARLDRDLSLETLAREAGQSTWHFHKCFRSAVGETPKHYTSRLRLERAAFLLLVFDDRVLDIALECGYQSHETFSRAFRRHFGSSPIEYRRSQRARSRDGARQARQILDDPERGFELSKPRVRRLATMHVAFLRHHGSYEQVPPALYQELRDYAERRSLLQPGQDPLFLGIGHDAPGVTPPEKLRYDVALRVNDVFVQDGPVACQTLEGGLFAVIQHVGALATLPLAYRAMAVQFQALESYRMQGPPVIEIYATAPLTAGLEVNRTDICLPVVKR